MSIPGSASPLFFQTAAAAAAQAFELVKSVRLNEADSAYLSRTFDSNGNRRTFTISCWIKRHELDENNYLIAARDGTNYPNSSIRAIRNSTEGFYFLDQTSSVNNILLQSHTTAVFRDPSAWYHFVIAIDTTQATESDRVKLYINGVQVTLSGTFPSQNFDCTISDNIQHTIGRRTKNTGAYEYGDGYFADYYYVDGAALRPTFFGAFDDNGVWQAKAYSDDVNFDPSYGLSSSDIVSSTGFQSGEGADKVIDSTDPTANRAHTVAGNAGEKITVTFSPAVTVNTSLEIYAYLTVSGDSEERRARVNGGDWFNPTSTADAYHDLGFTGSLSKIEIEYNGSTNSRSMTMRGIRIDGNFVHSGTTGVNGFHLFDFENESTVGHDSSGNNHDFSTSNISTSGAGNDVLFDVPTNSTTTDTGVGGEVSGNYCVLNPLVKGSNISLANGNLEASSTTGSGTGTVLGTIGVSSGKWYWEFTGGSGATGVGVGIAEGGKNVGTYLGEGVGYSYYSENGRKYSGAGGANYGASYGANDVIGVAFDADAGTLVFYKNGSSQGTAFTGLTNGPYFPAIADSSGTNSFDGVVNFGQRSFTHSAPSNHKCLCTTNLPTPTIAKGSDHFNAVLYTGNNTARSITGVGHSPDWVWIKDRSSSYHILTDNVRGVGKQLYSNTTDAEASNTDRLTSFDSDGFSIAANTASGGVNTNNAPYVAWCWDAKSAGSTNTDGSITSTVRANQTGGFSIATFTGTGANATVGHGLNAEPYLLLTKCRESGFNWAVYFKDLGNGKRLMLNNDLPAATSSIFWNNTTPTNSVFTVGTFFASGNTFVAYCFAPVKGFSTISSYSGSGSSGHFIHCGFRPAVILFKNTGNHGWAILDSKRTSFNYGSATLNPDTTGAEYTGAGHEVDFVSNGFVLRNTNNRFNASGSTYMFYAAAENPFSANGGLAR